MELQEDLGIYTAAYRSYDPAIGRWMQIDPRAEKYVSMSPYNGMGNNPILYSDPMGDTIRIGDGNGGFVTYTPGVEYTGDNETVAGAVGYLNTINSTESGATVISELSSAVGSYYTSKVSSDQLAEGAGAQFVSLGESNSGASTGGILYYTDATNTQTDLTHELFHGYQHETGQTELGTVAAEVGAFLFEDVVNSELLTGSGPVLSTSPQGQMYDQAHQNLLYNGFSQSDYRTAISNFKSSGRNATGLYNRTRSAPVPANPAIRKFIPIF